MDKRTKTPRQIERHTKGMSNHYRIAILLLLLKEGDLTLEQIIDAQRGNAKTIGQHTRKLHSAGLLSKEHQGKFVIHSLSPYGKMFAAFLSEFSKK